MKVLRLFVLLSFCISLKAIGQTVIEEIYQGSDHVAFDKVFSNPNGNWIFSGSANPDGSVGAGMYFLHNTNDLGFQNWHYDNLIATDDRPFLYSSAPRKGDVNITVSGEMLVAGYMEYCDTQGPITLLHKVDNNGNLLWEVAFQHESAWDTETGYSLIADGCDNDIAVATQDSVSVLSDSVIVANWASPITPIHHMMWESDSTLLVNAGSKTLRLQKNGSLLASVSLAQSESGIDIRTQNNEVWVLTDHSIEIFNQQLELTTSIDLSSYAGSRFEFVDVLGEVWFTDGNVLASIDAQYNINQLIEFEFPNASVVVRDSLVMTATTVSQNDKYAGLMKSYLLDGTSISDSQTDVELLIEVDSTNVTPVFHGSQVDAEALVHCTAYIVNHSGHNLQTILISSPEFPGVAWCGEPVMSVSLNDINIGIGDTAAFELPPILTYFGPNNPWSITRTVCVTAQSPNNHLDIQPEDNVSCQEATIILDANEHLAGSNIHVYPNPTTGVVNLPQIDNLKWQLMDATGRMVAEGSRETQIDLSSLGIAEETYSLLLTNDEVRTAIKLVYLKQ